jgi:hypothetical protein
MRASASPWDTRTRLRATSVLAALAVSGALAACSPYVFSDDTQAFSKAMASIDASYKNSNQQIEAERQQVNRVKWIRDRAPLKRGPGCTSSTTDPKPCEIVRRDATPEVASTRPKAPAPKPTEDVCKTDTAVDHVAIEGRAKGPTKLERASLLKAVDDYIAALAAVSKAQDRADFDNAAAKVSAAVGSLAQTAASFTPAAAGAGAAGAVAKASTNAALWLVGQGLDYQRLQQLKLSTEAACEPIHVVSGAIGVVLDEQRGNRLDGLYELIELKIQAVNRLGARATDQAYGAAIDDAVAAANSYQAVRASNPGEAAQALSDAHDALVVAVRNNNGEFAALVVSLQTLGQRASDLATAAAASPQPSAPAKANASPKES